MRLHYWIFSFALFFLSFHTYGAAITYAKLPSGRPLKGITIEGEIGAGDYENFVSLILDSETSIRTIWLASPGGNLIEALKIGYLIRELKLEVFAPDDPPWVKLNKINNNICASSCFFIYAAGINRFGERLGVHRPYLNSKDYEKISLDDAAITHSNIQQISTAYLQKMGVPSVIIEKVMATPSDEIAWLTNEEIKPLRKFIPEYQKWFKARCTPKGNIIEPMEK